MKQMLFKLEPEEKIVSKGGFVLIWPSFLFLYRNATDYVYLTNKRVVSKFLFLFKGLSIPLKDILAAKKVRHVFDDSIAINYKKGDSQQEKRIGFSTKKRRDQFYDELKKLIPSKVK